MDIATVAALPPDHLVLLEDLPLIQILEQGEVSFFMFFLHFSHFLEEIGNLAEAFIIGENLLLPLAQQEVRERAISSPSPALYHQHANLKNIVWILRFTTCHFHLK